MVQKCGTNMILRLQTILLCTLRLYMAQTGPFIAKGSIRRPAGGSSGARPLMCEPQHFNGNIDHYGVRQIIENPVYRCNTSISILHFCFASHPIHCGVLLRKHQREVH